MLTHSRIITVLTKSAHYLSFLVPHGAKQMDEITLSLLFPAALNNQRPKFEITK